MTDLVVTALNRALMGVDEPPTSIDSAADAFEGNAGLARAMNEIGPGARLPRKGTAARRRYDADLRRIQRYRAGAGHERRGAKKPDPEFLGRVRRMARAQLSRVRLAQARRSGLLMRLGAEIRVSRVVRYHTMPADAGGQPRFVHIGPQLAAPALNAWEAGDYDAAGDELLVAFFDAYDLPQAEVVGDVVMCQVQVP